MPEIEVARREEVGIALMMESYRRAWETRDAQRAAQLFTEDATYQVDAFSAPLEGREAIRRYWEEATRPHRDIRFQWELVARNGALYVVEWQVEFSRVDVDRRLELRGVMFIELSGNKIFRFREYWLRRENSSFSPTQRDDPC